MNASKSTNKFAPKQALLPTPQLYDELVGNGMEKLAEASLSFVTIDAGAIIHDNGCGTGAGSAAAIGYLSKLNKKISIKATDINTDALAIYQARAKENQWPAELLEADAQDLPFADNTFDLSIWNALVFIFPDDGVQALKETYRTLKPGGAAIVNSWAYVPNLQPVQLAATKTRPAGTPLPRQHMEKWTPADFLKNVLVKSGFTAENVKMEKVEVYCDTPELTHFATLLWSFIGGTSEAGWLESDEKGWDEAVQLIVQELRKTGGFQQFEDGKARLRFVANVAVATK